MCVAAPPRDTCRTVGMPERFWRVATIVKLWPSNGTIPGPSYRVGFVSKTMFKKDPRPPTNACKPPPVDKMAGDAKRGEHKACLMKESGGLSSQEWTMVYADGSAKKGRGWMQAGYGVWLGGQSPRNFHAHVPAHERQSISQGELPGVPHALQQWRPAEKMVLVLDSEHVSKGVVEWSAKWRRHGWRCSTGEVGLVGIHLVAARVRGWGCATAMGTVRPECVWQ